jgi:hypothetical protein
MQARFLADCKPAEWLAKPTKRLTSHFAGRGRMMPVKSIWRGRKRLWHAKK